MASRSSQAGFTLLELLIVAAILSFLAATTFMVRSGAENESAVEFAAAEIAAALRFARADAMRIGDYRAATIDPDTGQVRVAAVDVSSGMPAIGAPILHPVERRPYDFVFDQIPMTRNVAIANTDDPFTFVGITSTLTTVLFDAQGDAVFVWFGVKRHLKEGWVDVASGDYGRKVTLSRHGRVKINDG